MKRKALEATPEDLCPDRPAAYKRVRLLSDQYASPIGDGSSYYDESQCACLARQLAAKATSRETGMNTAAPTCETTSSLLEAHRQQEVTELEAQLQLCRVELDTATHQRDKFQEELQNALRSIASLESDMRDKLYTSSQDIAFLKEANAAGLEAIKMLQEEAQRRQEQTEKFAEECRAAVQCACDEKDEIQRMAADRVEKLEAEKQDIYRQAAETVASYQSSNEELDRHNLELAEVVLQEKKKREEVEEERHSATLRVDALQQSSCRDVSDEFEQNESIASLRAENEQLRNALAKTEASDQKVTHNHTAANDRCKRLEEELSSLKAEFERQRGQMLPKAPVSQMHPSRKRDARPSSGTRVTYVLSGNRISKDKPRRSGRGTSYSHFNSVSSLNQANGDQSHQQTTAQAPTQSAPLIKTDSLKPREHKRQDFSKRRTAKIEWSDDEEDEDTEGIAEKENNYREAINTRIQSMNDRLSAAHKNFEQGNFGRIPLGHVLQNSDGTEWASFDRTASGKILRSAVYPVQLIPENTSVHILPFPQQEDLDMGTLAAYSNWCLCAQLPEMQAVAAKSLLSPEEYSKFLDRCFGPDRPSLDFSKQKEHPEVWSKTVDALRSYERFATACRMWAAREKAMNEDRCWPPTFINTDKTQSCTVYSNEDDFNMDTALSKLMGVSLEHSYSNTTPAGPSPPQKDQQ